MDFIPIEKLRNKRPVTILIRHAQRHPVVDWDKVDEPLLTEAGQKDSFRLGERLLPLSPLTIYHSPFPRCQQTAEGISKGITSQRGLCNIVGAVPELAGQSIFMGQWQDIIVKVKAYGWASFIQKWFDGKFLETLIMPLNQAARFGLGFLLQQLESSETSTVNVTHDFFISVLREYFFDIRFSDFGIPKPLDAIAAYLSDGSVHLLYHEYECTMKLPLEWSVGQ